METILFITLETTGTGHSIHSPLRTASPPVPFLQIHFQTEMEAFKETRPEKLISGRDIHGGDNMVAKWKEM